MKLTNVKDEYGVLHKYFLIKNFDELREYADSMNSKVSDTINRVLKSNVPQDRWDHLTERSDAGGIMSAAIMRSKLTGENPLYTMEPLFLEKLKTMSGYLLKDETLLINENGGYCTYTPGCHTILSEEEYVEPTTYMINKDTQYINLENDPDLEERTEEYLGEVDPNYSYICCLRKFSEEELVGIFREFMANGGTTVYIYTTGMDVPQMYSYCDAIIESGLKAVEYEFVGEDNQGILEYLKENGVEATLIDR